MDEKLFSEMNHVPNMKTSRWWSVWSWFSEIHKCKDK